MKIVRESKDSIDIFFDNKEIYEYTNGMMPRDKAADIMIRMAQEHKLSFFNTDKGDIISFIVLCNNYSMIRLVRTYGPIDEERCLRMADEFYGTALIYMIEMMQENEYDTPVVDTHDTVVMESTNIEDLKQCINKLGLSGRSSLYKSKQVYKLIFLSKKYNRIIHELSEFADVKMYSKYNVETMQEHDKLIVKNKAIDIIKEYY